MFKKYLSSFILCPPILPFWLSIILKGGCNYIWLLFCATAPTVVQGLNQKQPFPFQAQELVCKAALLAPCDGIT